jgi:hypothetical protein
MIGEFWQSETLMRSPQLLSALLAMTLAANPLQAQEKKPIAEKHDAQALANALRDVINTGADLFNMHGDYAGCYRVYQGGLLSIKPFLTPDLQKKIDEGIAKAERLPRYSDRAFELRSVIDEIRSQSKGGASATGKKDESMKATADDPNAGGLQGMVTYNGRPAPPGFITLVGSDKRRFSSSITEGKYKFKTPIPPGTYRIAIERVPDAKIPANLDIPERYRNEGTSGLTAEVRAGKMNLDLNLVK